MSGGERTVIEVEDLTVRFGGVMSIDQISVTFPSGTCGLIGPNGAGKTTFLNVLSGFVRPAAGRVAAFGDDLLVLSDYERARWGVRRTFQTEQAIGHRRADPGRRRGTGRGRGGRRRPPRPGPRFGGPWAVAALGAVRRTGAPSSRWPAASTPSTLPPPPPSPAYSGGTDADLAVECARERGADASGAGGSWGACSASLFWSRRLSSRRPPTPAHRGAGAPRSTPPAAAAGGETDPGVRLPAASGPGRACGRRLPRGAGLDNASLVGGVIDPRRSARSRPDPRQTSGHAPRWTPTGGDNYDLYQGLPLPYPGHRPDHGRLADLPGPSRRTRWPCWTSPGCCSWTPPDPSASHNYEAPGQSWAGVAYSLLRRANEMAPVLRLAAGPLLRDVDGLRTAHRGRRGGGRARGRGLSRRPHPAWLLGQVQYSPGLADRVVLQVRAGTAGDGARRRGDVRRAARTTRTHLLGWAGAGDLYLQLADEAEQLSLQPFQVRAWRRDALAVYVEARRRSDDAALLVRLGTGAFGQRPARRGGRRPGGRGGAGTWRAGAPDAGGRAREAGPAGRRRRRPRRHPGRWTGR